jgi:hypothetical protein
MIHRTKKENQADLVSHQLPFIIIPCDKKEKFATKTTKKISKNPLFLSTTLDIRLDGEQQKQQTDGIASENKLS